MQIDIFTTGLEYHASGREPARLLTLFRGLVEQDGRASVEALLEAADPFLTHSIEVLAPKDDGGWRYVRFGSAIAAATGSDMTGLGVDALEEALRKSYEAAIGRLLRERRPILAVDRSLAPVRLRFWERLMLPCRNHAGEERVVSFVRPGGGRDDLLRAVFEASQDGMIVLRATRGETGAPMDAEIVAANAKAAEYVGSTPSSMRDARFSAVFPDSMARKLWPRCRRVVEERVFDRFELDVTHGGVDAWLRVTLAPLADGVVVSFADVTDLKNALIEAEKARRALAREVELRRALEEELRQLSLTDDLTGLANRRAFIRALRRETRRAHRDDTPFSIVAADLDRFKAINDAHGHAAGDEALIAIAALFTDATRREVDFVARTGGEEFMLILPRTDLAAAVVTAERLRGLVAATPVSANGAILRLTASFGVKEFDGSADPRALVREADEALYRAKRGGRDCVVACQPEPLIDASAPVSLPTR
ncbi:MAG: sensor domain-containing diguanylate cyclase [Salinarimonadaceae bacterium]|nr:MAG: sensor domain-containing diguanylate cyclase [Salinarimonadaceae bacterium]